MMATATALIARLSLPTYMAAPAAQPRVAVAESKTGGQTSPGRARTWLLVRDLVVVVVVVVVVVQLATTEQATEQQQRHGKLQT